MSVVVSHLYHHRDVFLRELVSNAGDALEKARLESLRSGSDAGQFNVTIKADKQAGTLVISGTELQCLSKKPQRGS
jgi:heat shock protein beta